MSGQYFLLWYERAALKVQKCTSLNVGLKGKTVPAAVIAPSLARRGMEKGSKVWPRNTCEWERATEKTVLLETADSHMSV